MENYIEIILEDKIYIQRTPTSKFVEFDINGIKQRTYENLPIEIKDMVILSKEMEKFPEEFFFYETNYDGKGIILEGIKENISVPYIKIPETINNLPVTILGDNFAYNIRETIEHMQLPETINFFGDYTFSNCKKLKHINLPHKINTIPSSCFVDCGLVSIDLSNIEYISHRGFYNCNSLKEIKLNKVKSIGVECFTDCNNLETLIISSEDITKIEKRSFWGCKSLKNLVLPSQIKTIGASAFRGCISLTDFTAPEALETIESFAFAGNKFKTIILPNVESIQEKSFMTMCEIPTKVILGDETRYYTDSFSRFADIEIKEIDLER